MAATTKQNRVLITGFETFGGGTLNPSGAVANALHGELIGNLLVTGRILPVSFDTLRSNVKAAIQETTPDLILGLGLLAGEPMIRLETLAINRSGAAGRAQGSEQSAPLILDDPGLRSSTLPTVEVVQALHQSGIPARISTAAGSDFCNATFYTLLSVQEKVRTRAACGFVHLPYLPHQVVDLMSRSHGEFFAEFSSRSDLASMPLENRA